MQALKIAGFLPTLMTSQFFVNIPIPEFDFSGQTVIVTGSNTGLGKEAARHLVRLKASKVILAVRTVSKGEAAAKDIVESCKVSADVVEVWELDSGDEASIDAFAKRVQALERLDAAILNAGVMTMEWRTVDVHESTLAVNAFGNLRLTKVLLPKMQDSARRTGQQGRISVVGSDMMYVANLGELETDGKIVDKLDSKDLSLKWMGQRYQLSKILIFWAMKQLAKVNPVAGESGVVLTVMTPGACKSTIFRDPINPRVKNMADWVMALFQRTTEVGGRALVHAIEPQLPQEAHGKFLMDARVGSEGLNVTSKQAERLAAKWNEEVLAVVEDHGNPKL
ncbi:Short chain dehydrogenase atnD [Fulvia fulva]|nr:Short chain dehydrogenase atnD [Fulvia fulva]KAK4622853.1 Short chain dehydrogenase atnD [Fulvia fulva]WPV15812.1 Short chain dehydrogenase atnD [Fulvia fulva]